MVFNTSTRDITFNLPIYCVNWFATLWDRSLSGTILSSSADSPAESSTHALASGESAVALPHAIEKILAESCARTAGSSGSAVPRPDGVAQNPSGGLPPPMYFSYFGFGILSSPRVAIPAHTPPHWVSSRNSYCTAWSAGSSDLISTLTATIF